MASGFWSRWHALARNSLYCYCCCLASALAKKDLPFLGSWMRYYPCLSSICRVSPVKLPRPSNASSKYLTSPAHVSTLSTKSPSCKTLLPYQPLSANSIWPLLRQARTQATCGRGLADVRHPSLPAWSHFCYRSDWKIPQIVCNPRRTNFKLNFYHWTPS